jgi:energy-coupling factor transporter transmembrane protein EcfT
MAVGYNPYRRFRPRTADYVLVLLAVLVVVALVTWALVG